MASRFVVFSVAFALLGTSVAVAADQNGASGEANGGSPPAAAAQPSKPPAPIIITRPNGSLLVDHSQTDTIEDTVGRNPRPGLSEEVKCPGGQTVTDAQGDVHNVICK